MELQLEHPGDYPYVRHVDEHSITVVDRELRQLDASFILTPERVVEDWPVTDVRRMQVSDTEALLASGPEVILLGTGNTQAFPPAAVMAAILKQGIGIEPMDNAAAARTHTVLAGEDRKVVAAFILS
ncbi:MAG TPA: Mth938-like domain-containing protein [Oleiagrimonas sp.]|nr:Mth938-like domain-containing protein [Oleiagrimonas sp.]